MSEVSGSSRIGGGVPPKVKTQRSDHAARPLNPAVSWCFVAAGVAAASLTRFAGSGEARSFAFDALSIIAAGGAVYGILRNRPDGKGAWLLLAIGMALFAAGDVAYDLATMGQAAATGYPWANASDLLAYPCIAIALYLLARKHFRRDTTVDSAIVALGGVGGDLAVGGHAGRHNRRGRDARADLRRGISDHGRAARGGDRARRLHTAEMGPGGVVPLRRARRDAHRRHRLRAARRRQQLRRGEPARRALAHRLHPVRGGGAASVDAEPLVHPPYRVRASRTRAHDRARRGAVLGAGGGRLRRCREHRNARADGDRRCHRRAGCVAHRQARGGDRSRSRSARGERGAASARSCSTRAMSSASSTCRE